VFYVAAMMWGDKLQSIEDRSRHHRSRFAEWASVYIGDDVTDEDGIRATRAMGAWAGVWRRCSAIPRMGALARGDRLIPALDRRFDWRKGKQL
jgi:hypothetical protein